MSRQSTSIYPPVPPRPAAPWAQTEQQWERTWRDMTPRQRSNVLLARAGREERAAANESELRHSRRGQTEAKALERTGMTADQLAETVGLRGHWSVNRWLQQAEAREAQPQQLELIYAEPEAEDDEAEAS